MKESPMDDRIAEKIYKVIIRCRVKTYAGENDPLQGYEELHVPSLKQAIYDLLMSELDRADIAKEFETANHVVRMSGCCNAAVSDPSGEGKEGRCTDCGEMCQIVSGDERESAAMELLGDRWEDFKEYVDGIEDWDMSDVERYMNR